MTTYVLVGGAWLGGWCWQPVTAQLRAQGHDVYPVTLTGLGERSHLASREVDLDTYIGDVVNVIEFEDLQDVVLVGHSDAGLVVTAVADRIPERISLLTYLDSGPIPDATAYLDMQPPAARELIGRLVEESRERVAGTNAVLGGTGGRPGCEPGRARTGRAQPNAWPGHRPAAANLDPVGIAEESGP